MRAIVLDQWDSFKDTIELKKRGNTYKVDFHFLGTRHQTSLLTDSLEQAEINLKEYIEEFPKKHIAGLNLPE